MKINQTDAFSILNIQTTEVTPEDIKTAYHKAVAKYHPDRNPAGTEMMQLVNLAYETLQNYEGKTNISTETTTDYGEAINNALNAIINLGLTIEICGAWVWVSGDTKPHKETLKTAGFSWAPKKFMWYFRPAEHKSHNHCSWSMDKIREIYGSDEIKEQRKTLTNNFTHTIKESNSQI